MCPLWFGTRVVAHVDNEAAVALLNLGYSKEGEIMHLIKIFVAFYQILLSACHIIPGAQNGTSDAISLFFSLLQVVDWWTGGRPLFLRHWWHCWGPSDWTGHRQLGPGCSGAVFSWIVGSLIEGLQDGSEPLCLFWRAVCPFAISGVIVANDSPKF